jgi:hypothetical protein
MKMVLNLPSKNLEKHCGKLLGTCTTKYSSLIIIYFGLINGVCYIFRVWKGSSEKLPDVEVPSLKCACPKSAAEI